VSVRLVHVTPQELGRYQDSLRRLEANIRYPIADGADHFRIDHGPSYAAFFTGLGEAHFLLALDGDEVVGTCAAIGRFAEAGGRRAATLYGADLKIAPAHRGGALARRFVYRGFVDVFRPSTRRRWPWRLAYVAAMHGARGDVMRSARGLLNPMRLARAAARLAVYFAQPEALAALPHHRCPPGPSEAGLNLSPDAKHEADGTVSTRGRKDLCLESTGEAWPLVHLPLGPAAWRPTWGAYLAAGGDALTGSGATACFAIDERLTDQTAWLASVGIRPGATCTIYALRLPLGPRPAPWVHLATSEI
jgi:hypothetical protein